MYAVDWSGASTNLGIDLLGITLGRAIGAAILGKLLIAAALILPPLGAALLNRVVFTGCGIGGWSALQHWHGTAPSWRGSLVFRSGSG